MFRVAAQYPPVLKNKQIGGGVRITVIVSPSGLVKRAEVKDGNPALVTAAENALKAWKDEPTAVETRDIVAFRFDPFSQR
jgi:TonB family protein